MPTSSAACMTASASCPAGSARTCATNRATGARPRAHRRDPGAVCPCVGNVVRARLGALFPQPPEQGPAELALGDDLGSGAAVAGVHWLAGAPRPANTTIAGLPRALIRRAASSPLMPGIRTSIRTRSGWRRSASSTPSSPEQAAPTQWKPDVASTSSRATSWKKRSSSTIRTRTSVVAVCSTGIGSCCPWKRHLSTVRTCVRRTGAHAYASETAGRAGARGRFR